jgi:hypothetical protein
MKYNQSIIRESVVLTNFKKELISNIQMMIKNPEARNVYDIMTLQLLLEML